MLHELVPMTMVGAPNGHRSVGIRKFAEMSAHGSSHGFSGFPRKITCSLPPKFTPWWMEVRMGVHTAFQSQVLDRACKAAEVQHDRLACLSVSHSLVQYSISWQSIVWHGMAWHGILSS